MNTFLTVCSLWDIITASGIRSYVPLNYHDQIYDFLSKVQTSIQKGTLLGFELAIGHIQNVEDKQVHLSSGMVFRLVRRGDHFARNDETGQISLYAPLSDNTQPYLEGDLCVFLHLLEEDSHIHELIFFSL